MLELLLRARADADCASQQRWCAPHGGLDVSRGLGRDCRGLTARLPPRACRGDPDPRRARPRIRRSRRHGPPWRGPGRASAGQNDGSRRGSAQGRCGISAPTDDDSFRRSPWQAESPSAVRLESNAIMLLLICFSRACREYTAELEPIDGMLLDILAAIARKNYEDRRRMCQAGVAPLFP
jgi:hypothetical protein